MSASLADIFTGIKNLVQGINGIQQAYLNVEGVSNAPGLTAATVVKASAGRVCRVSVIVAGSAAGNIYDSAVTGVTTKPLYVIPNTVGVYDVRLPASFGILVAPGTGQTVTVSWS
jgi:hypothetical protein